MNEKKAEFMIIKDDFEYLGSWINNTERDMKIRIAKAWSALNKVDVLWKSILNRDLKISIFQSNCRECTVIRSREFDSHKNSTDSIKRNIYTTLTNSTKYLLGAAQNQQGVIWRASTCL